MQDHTIDPSDFREQLELLQERKLATENICAELRFLLYELSGSSVHTFSIAFFDENERTSLARINCDHVEIERTTPHHTFVSVSS